MDLCSIEDAFPNIDTGSAHVKWKEGSGLPYVGGTDAKPSRDERRAARKRAKKVKGPALTYSDSVTPDLPPTDPDRPVNRLESVGTIQDGKDGFKMPVLPKASCLFSDTGTPAYFGNDGENEEGFSSFSASNNDNPNYMLQPDFTKTFDLKGVGKAGGELPEPNIDQTWKPMSPAASYTAFVHGEHATPGWSMNTEDDRITTTIPTPPALVNPKHPPDDRAAIMGRINELMGRLESLEKKKTQDSQTEILVFVGTGIFLLLSFDLMTRR